jgi:DNA topoisomerase IA
MAQTDSGVPSTAERILADLTQRGYIRVDDQALETGELGYRVLGLNAPAAPPALSAGEPGAPSL